MGRFVRAAWGIVGVALGGSAEATPPPRCTNGAPSVHASIPLGEGGVVSRVAIATDGDRIFVAARVLPLRRERHGQTRIVVGTLGADGWAADASVVTRWPGRVDGDLSLAVRDGVPHVLATGPSGARAVAMSGEGAANGAILDLAPPAHAAHRTPVIAALDDRFALLWPMAHRARVQFLAFDATAPTDAGAVELPTRTLVIGAVAGPEGRTGIVVQTSSRRYWTAVIDRDGALHWPRTAPAGCDRNFCPEVHLHRAENGWVASWRGRRTEGDLRPPAAIQLDAEGRLIGHADVFLPMVHGVGVAGPHGVPLAVQLGRPSVLRGGEHPIALDGTNGDPRTPPTLVATAAVGDGLTVVTVEPDGTLVASHVTCPASRTEASSDPPR